MKKTFQVGLATEYDPLIQWGSFMAQSKCDGVRTWAIKQNGHVELYTRNNKLIKGCSHIKQELEQILEDGQVLDGELYCHNISFQSILSLVKTTGDNLDFIVFDLPLEQTTYFTRFEKLKSIVAGCQHVKPVTTYNKLVKTEKQIEQAMNHFIKNGFEGVILRTDSNHENGRTETILKKKPLETTEFKIIDIYKTNTGRLIASMVTSANKQFNAVVSGDSDQKKTLFYTRKRKIGKFATVSHQGFTNDGLPRFARMICVRNYE